MIDMQTWTSELSMSLPQWEMSAADWLIVAETGALTLATIVLAVFTAGLYFQTKRANRPHVSVSLEHASEMGACVLSIENHGPGVAFNINVELEHEYRSGEKLALALNDTNLQIPYLKPGKARNLRIAEAKNLVPDINHAKVKYRDVFREKMNGEFELRTSVLMAYDPIFKNSHMWEEYFHSAVSAIAKPLSALPQEIEALRREVKDASRSFRIRH